MIIETINPGVHNVRLKVKEMIYGNDTIDKHTGWDKVNPTLIKVRCTDCTLMVFGEKDMALFKGLSIGATFDALVHDSRYKNVFKFKCFL